MKKITAFLVGIALSLSMAGLGIAQQPAAPTTEQKKEMTDKGDQKAEKGEKKATKAKKTTKKSGAATADEKDEYQKKEGPKKEEPKK